MLMRIQNMIKVLLKKRNMQELINLDFGMVNFKSLQDIEGLKKGIGQSKYIKRL